MSQDAKELIRSRLSIAEVVGEVVALKPAGRGSLKGLCPFHNEKTPSFHVHEDKGFYYCFGCRAKGDVFDFVMHVQSIDFAQALQLLGAKAGVEVTPTAPRDKGKRDLYGVNDLALEFFRTQLEQGPAYDYLLARGLNEASISAFELGYAPASWDSLLKFTLHKGVAEKDLLAAGLIAEAESGRRYDRFRNRAIFPIKDALGRVVGFSGRVLDDSLPKYLNTPETEIFDKSKILYGLDKARAAIRASGECIAVEGYMDVIALHQTGFLNSVAALGATLTAEQAAQLSRLDVQRLYLAFDADEAGQRAVLAGLDQSVGRQFLVRAVKVPHGKDPADAVLGGFVEDFRRALLEGLAEVAFRFQTVVNKHDKTTLEGKKAILEELLPSLRPKGVFDPVASELRRLVIDHLKIDGGRLDDWVNAKRSRRLDETQLKGMERASFNPSRMVLLELEIIAFLLYEPAKLQDRLLTVEAALPPLNGQSVLREFRTICEEADYDEGRVLLKYREREEGSLLYERLFSQEGDDMKLDVDANLQRSLARLRELYLDNEKEKHRERLLERMHEVSRFLTSPGLPPQQLQHYYLELKEIQEMLSARYAERRIRNPAGPTGVVKAGKRR
jgi:DNA primase